MSTHHVRAFLAERVTPWNGALYTRGTLLKLLRQQGWSDKAIDFWVFRKASLSDQEIEQMLASGCLINSIPNVFPDWYEE